MLNNNSFPRYYTHSDRITDNHNLEEKKRHYEYNFEIIYTFVHKDFEQNFCFEIKSFK